MFTLKILFLSFWFVSFGTLVYLLLTLFRRVPMSSMIAPRVLAAYTTYNIAWWLGVAACFVLSFFIVKGMAVRSAIWAVLLVTEIVPVGILTLFCVLAMRVRSAAGR